MGAVAHELAAGAGAVEGHQHPALVGVDQGRPRDVRRVRRVEAAGLPQGEVEDGERRPVRPRAPAARRWPAPPTSPSTCASVVPSVAVRVGSAPSSREVVEGLAGRERRVEPEEPRRADEADVPAAVDPHQVRVPDARPSRARRSAAAAAGCRGRAAR